MNEKYEENAKLFKALSDRNRLRIIHMLSKGELCACMLLAEFNITQPTLSHHMCYLCDCDLVKGRKEGKWMYYSLNKETIKNVQFFLDKITSSEYKISERDAIPTVNEVMYIETKQCR